MRFKTILCTAIVLLSTHTFVQQPESKLGCKDKVIVVQATEQKTSLIQQGFEPMNDAMITMESKEDFPVVVRLHKGTYYQIVFIGNPKAKKMNLEMYDSAKKLIQKKACQPYSESVNMISFSYAPEKDESISFIINQTLKQKSILDKKESTCGSFSIMKLKQSH